MQDPRSPRQRALDRKARLWRERASWDADWRDIAQYQAPSAVRFVSTEQNDGRRKNQLIHDNTGIFALRTLGAGMMSGVSSPARPWFRSGLADKDLLEFAPVKAWLHKADEIMRAIFSASNTYGALRACYRDLGAFGTWASIVVPSFDNVIHHHPLAVGQYALAANNEAKVDTLVREMDMTVAQVVREFGLDAVSQSVKNLWDRGMLEERVPVVHVIEPRENTRRDLRKADGPNMAFASIYFEPAAGDPDRDFLRESGYRRFPVLAPRWDVEAGDVYGQSPGRECQGDVKQLQHEQLRKAQAIDYKVNPPLQVPSTYKETARARLPGGVMYVDQAGPSGGVRSAFEVNIDLQHLLIDIEDVRNRIRQAYYADLFLMLANDTRSGTTATEIAQRHEEKLLMLGPVLERLHNELLSPLIDMTFDRCLEAGIFPPVPEELQGHELQVEYISPLAQAQRAVAAGGLDRLLGTVGTLVAIKPDVADKVDLDQAIDDYADMFNVNPEVIVPDDKVAELRAARAQQQAAQQAAAAAPMMADAAKTASEVDLDNMSDVMSRFTGYQGQSAEFVG